MPIEHLLSGSEWGVSACVQWETEFTYRRNLTKDWAACTGPGNAGKVGRKIQSHPQLQGGLEAILGYTWCLEKPRRRGGRREDCTKVGNSTTEFLFHFPFLLSFWTYEISDVWIKSKQMPRGRKGWWLIYGMIRQGPSLCCFSWECFGFGLLVIVWDRMFYNLG